MEIVFFIGGLIALIAGAEFIVKGSAKIALYLGISPLVIGLTIVAMGTSAPELAVSIQSGLEGKEGIALGNVIGSNIMNILLILGLSALIHPLKVDQRLVQIEVPIMIASSFIVYFMSLNDVISRNEGIVLFSGIILYIIYTLVKSRKEKKKIIAEYEEEFGKKSELTKTSVLISSVLVVIGFILLVKGSEYLVEGAVNIARYFEVSEFIISILIIALGTSLPEAATSVVAGLRGENDIAVGNAVGSNIFNLLSVMGAAAIFTPGGIDVDPGALSVDIPVMIAVAIACLPVFMADHTITRFRGGLFFGYFIFYVAYLIISAKEHQYLTAFNWIMLLFVIPLTLITFVYLMYKGILTHKNQKHKK
ncbi:MAG: calcium/sodium antiporter [Spirochaetia bacterium]|nr:calcium/sodium antiporter [Spirochaetia bacterium]